MNSRFAGFSLVELLVVVLIIGLSISLVSINIGSSSHVRLRMEAQQFANNTSLMAEEAVLSNQQWGVDIFRQQEAGIEQFGYRWLLQNDEGKWLLANGREMQQAVLFSGDIGLRLQLDALEQDQHIDFKQEIKQYQPEKALKNADEKQHRNRIIDQQGIVQREQIEPDIWLFSSGEMNVFVLTVFDRRQPENQIVIRGDELGRIRLDADEKAND